MFRVLSLLLVLITFPLRMQAQRTIVSPAPIDENGYDYAKVIGQDEGGFYVLMSNLSLDDFRARFGLKTRRYELDYFGYNLQPVWKKELGPAGSATIENISMFNGAVVVVSSLLEKSTAQLQLYIDVINEKGEALATQRKVYSAPLGKNDDVRKTRVVIAPDRSKMGIAVEATGSEGIRIHYTGINEQFQPSAQSTAALNFSPRDAELSEFAISNREDLLFLCYRKQTNEEKEKSKLRNFTVQYLAAGGKEFKEFVFNQLSQLMTEAALVIDRVNNTAIVTGFFADKTSYSGASLLYGTINLQQPTALQVNTGKLSNDARMRLVGQRNSGGGISLYNYPIQRVIPRSDGGALVIAEAAYLSEYSFYDYFTQTFNRRIEYHFDNILALSVNANGSIHWGQLIEKEQTSMDDEGLYSSFNTLLTPEDLSVVFNNDIGRNNEIVCHSINAKGELSLKRFSKSGDSISILPRSGRQVDENTLIVPAITRKRLYLVKLEL